MWSVADECGSVWIVAELSNNVKERAVYTHMLHGMGDIGGLDDMLNDNVRPEVIVDLLLRGIASVKVNRKCRLPAPRSQSLDGNV
jgi:hypothetical protein